MKIFMKLSKPKYGITRIEFCCHKMSESLLMGDIKVRHWTDHRPAFHIKDFNISCCPHCGAEIEGIWDSDEEYQKGG